VRPGVTGKTIVKLHSKAIGPKGLEIMKRNLDQQLADFRALRDQKNARMDEIMDSAAEKGETLDSAQKEEYDTLSDEIKEIDEHVVRLDARKKTAIATARAVELEDGEDADRGVAVRGAIKTATGIIRVNNPKLEKGIAFARYVGAMAAARGNRSEAAEFAKHHWSNSSPEIEQILRMPLDVITRTAVNPGTTTDTTWASPLVNYQILATEFINYLRPLTILGRLTGFRNIPFKVKVPRQTAGASVNWVGEAKVKPVSSLAFDMVSLDITKIAGIIPLSEELLRFSNPSAEALVRDDLAAAITQFLDAAFIDPSKASTDVSPAAVTYGATSQVATGTTGAAFRSDAKTILSSLLSSNQQITNAAWIMTQHQALSFSLMFNSLGVREFPDINVNGGTLIGFPVVTSENLPSSTGSPADGYPIFFVLPNEILLADDGAVTIDMSREASLQMDTSPDSPTTGSTVLVSLWQQNMVAIKAERYINWKGRRSTVAAYITGANYFE
jgi:HK97 family phage major capsid protein